MGMCVVSPSSTSNEGDKRARKSSVLPCDSLLTEGQRHPKQGPVHGWSFVNTGLETEKQAVALCDVTAGGRKLENIIVRQ